MEKKLINVAIDGTSSSGKSTMAKALAKYAGYTYIDTGAMYRAVTLYCLQHGFIRDGKVDVQRLVAALGDIKISFRLDGGVQHTCLNGVDVEKEIRGLEVSNNVSPVAAVPQVRHELVRQQQELGRGKGVVMDGRDIGTTVLPDAEIKIYVTSSPEVRAQRRYREMLAKGESGVTLDEVVANVRMRDHIDSTRAESPLRKAEGACELDSTPMSADEQNQWMIDYFNRWMQSHGYQG